MLHNMYDAPQQALGFLVNQASTVETEVYKMRYPEIQYPALIPVSTAGNEWAKSITFFSAEYVGEAAWFHHMASDMRIADVNRSKYEQGIEMASIGYRYTLEELGQAMMMGMPLTTEKAEAARRAYELFMERIAFYGDTAKGWTGLINDTVVTRVDAAADGTGNVPGWPSKTADLIIRDINDALTGVHTASRGVEVANTILLPLSALSLIATKRIDGTSMTVMQYLVQNNSYTMMTGQPLTIRGVHQLDVAGSATTGRMVVYRRDPQVLKLHIPMPHRFLEARSPHGITFDVPGIFRTGGTEIRLPGAVRYVDKIMPTPA